MNLKLLKNPENCDTCFNKVHASESRSWVRLFECSAIYCPAESDTYLIKNDALSALLFLNRQ